MCTYISAHGLHELDHFYYTGSLFEFFKLSDLSVKWDNSFDLEVLKCSDLTSAVRGHMVDGGPYRTSRHITGIPSYLF